MSLHLSGRHSSTGDANPDQYRLSPQGGPAHSACLMLQVELRVRQVWRACDGKPSLEAAYCLLQIIAPPPRGGACYRDGWTLFRDILNISVASATHRGNLTNTPDLPVSGSDPQVDLCGFSMTPPSCECTHTRRQLLTPNSISMLGGGLYLERFIINSSI